MNDQFSAQPPPEPDPAATGARPSSATGIRAVTRSLRIALQQMGPRRTLNTLLNANQREGFDCPSCAWPDPDDRSAMEFCENGVKAIASEATLARADPAFFATHSVVELASRSDLWLDRAGRLTNPMVLDHGATHYRPVPWDEAFRLISEELRALPTPDAAVFYTSGRTSNEAAFLYQLFVRLFGTNNLPDCSNMCHESSGYAMSGVIGVGKGTVRLEDFDLADSIWIIGQNPGTNHPRMLATLQAAARRGCRIVSVNPLREVGLERFKHPQEIAGVLGSGTPLASLFIPVRVGGDVAFFKGVMKRMLEEDEREGGVLLAHEFIARRTAGFDELRADLLAEPWRRIVERSGVSRQLIEEAAAVALASRRMICCWAMGITQHEHAVANIQSIINFLLLGGHIGRPGAGACPVRGHSNVQGDRTMGICERMPEAFLERLGAEFGFKPPRRDGLDVVDSIRAMHEGRVGVFFALGGNFLSATPDTEFTAAALRKCRLTVQVSTKLNRSHLITGERAIILPTLGRTERDVRGGVEQFVTVEDSMSHVHASRGVLEPASPDLRSEVAIVSGLAKAVLGSGIVDWDGLCCDYGRIRDRIERVVPGFANFNERAEAGFYLPNAAREGRFETDSGRARFTVHPIPQQRAGTGELLLMTIRSHDQFNTTVYGLDDRYRGIKGGRRVVFMNRADMEARSLASGDLVDISSHSLSGERVGRGFQVVAYEIPRGCIAAYFPEANVLVPVDHVAAGSNQPASKSVVVRVARSVV